MPASKPALPAVPAVHVSMSEGACHDGCERAGAEGPRCADRSGCHRDAAGVRQPGQVEAPADRYWGAQTQRSLQHFNIGNDRMPKEVYHAYGYVKKAAAVVNTRAARLPAWKGELIERVCDEVISGALDEEFPLLCSRPVRGPSRT